MPRQATPKAPRNALWLKKWNMYTPAGRPGQGAHRAAAGALLSSPPGGRPGTPAGRKEDHARTLSTLLLPSIVGS
jgi:hypothetical protein